MRRITALLLVFLLTVGAMLTSCNSDTDKQETSSTTVSALESTAQTNDITESNAETNSETESNTETDSETANKTESTTESVTESTTESETETELEPTEETALDVSEFDVEPQLPDDADKSYECGDGAILEQFDNVDKDGFFAAGAYYLNEGYTAYSKNTVGDVRSLVVTKGDEVVTLLHDGNAQQLNITADDSASLLPAVDEGYTKICDVAITQRYSHKINGMGYVVQLEDGSFIVYDGGYNVDVEELYKVLHKNNKTHSKIHIRAWLMTHAHNDHYTTFGIFAKKYAKKVVLDTVLYAPANNLHTMTDEMAYYDETFPADVAKFDGAKLCPIHAGMSFNLGGVKLEILYTSEYLAMNQVIANSNNTSIVSRIVNDDGSMLFTGDIANAGCKWIMNTYGDSLKSDIVQVAHHGVEDAPAEFYDKVSAPMLFWPCSESLFGQYRGKTVKQHIIEAEYSIEHILHSYGSITRPLSYKPQRPEKIDLFPTSDSLVSGSNSTLNTRIENGVIKYEIADTNNPYVSIRLDGIETGKCNMLRIVVSTDACEGSEMFITFGNMDPEAYIDDYKKAIGTQGTSDDGKMTLLVYLDNLMDFTGKLNAIRLDLGNNLEVGKTVEIYSIEAYYVNMEYTE